LPQRIGLEQWQLELAGRVKKLERPEHC